MRMKDFVAAMLAFAAMAASVPAANADTSCTSTLTGRINDNVVVPSGATCTLAGGVTVTGKGM
jgi:hypothetical protein